MRDPGREPNGSWRSLAFGNAALYSSCVSTTPSTNFPKARRSACADASREAERKRLLAMTVEERILEALSLKRRFQDLIPKDKGSTHGPRI